MGDHREGAPRPKLPDRGFRVRAADNILAQRPDNWQAAPVPGEETSRLLMAILGCLRRYGGLTDAPPGLGVLADAVRAMAAYGDVHTVGAAYVGRCPVPCCGAELKVALTRDLRGIRAKCARPCPIIDIGISLKLRDRLALEVW